MENSKPNDGQEDLKKIKSTTNLVSNQSNLAWGLSITLCLSLICSEGYVLYNKGWEALIQDFSAIKLLKYVITDMIALTLSLVGSIASYRAWALTAKIADAQDQQLASVHDATLSKLDQAVEKLESNLKIQYEEIQRGRETIDIERRARSFFRLRTLGNTENNLVSIYRMEENIAGHSVSFTPVTEDHCVGIVERYLNYCRQNSADIRFSIQKCRYPRNANRPSGQVSIYLNLSECIEIEEIKADEFPVTIHNGKFKCRGEEISDSEQTYKAIIARFLRGGRQIFVLAGLSQQGTQMASDFLDKLMKLDAGKAEHELQISSDRHRIMSGIAEPTKPDCSQPALDGSPARTDFCCILKGCLSESDMDNGRVRNIEAFYIADQFTDSKTWRES